MRAGRPRACHAVLALAIALMLSWASVGTAAAIEGPNGRVYEKLTPDDKNGGSARPGMVFDGDHVSVSASASFLADDPFFGDFSLVLGSRSAPEWTLRPGYVGAHTLVADFNRDFSQEIITSDQRCFPCTSLLPADTDGAGDVYARTSAGLRWVSQGSQGGNSGEEASYRGQSANGSSIFFETSESLEPADTGRLSGVQLYERIGNQTRVVGLDSDESLISDGGAVLGHGNVSAPSGSSNAISADGSRVFFESPDPSLGGNSQLYVRISGQDTLHVSASQCDRELPDPPCVDLLPATFQGASVDGSVVFFTTASQLVDDDTDDRADLYRYAVAGEDAGQLTLVSQGCIGEDGTTIVDCDFPAGLGSGGEVEGMVAVSTTGQRIYFANHDTIWFYDSEEGTPRFVAPAEPNVVMRGLGDPPPTASATPDGRFLVLETAAQLTSFENESPRCAGPCFEVYRYSAESDEMQCVSCNSSGTSPLGHSRIFGALFGQGLAGGVEKALWPSRVMSDDGSNIAFESVDALVPQDTNGVTDVYEWRNGQFALQGMGGGNVPALLAGISADGRDIFFATTERLVESDLDLRADLYDARVDGTPEPEDTSPPPCQDEGCQPFLPPPAFSTPGSVTLEGRGNVKPSKPRAAKPKKKCKRGKVRRKVRGKVRCVKKPAKKRGDRNTRVRSKGV